MAGDRPPPYESAAGQHGGGQAPALRVLMPYLRSGDRKLQREEGPMPGRRDLLVSMQSPGRRDLLVSMHMAGDRPPPYESAAGHGGGQAPALR